MSRKVLVESEASSELREAALWYEAQRSGVPRRCRADHGTGCSLAGDREAGVAAELPGRKLSIPRFPYYLACLVADDAIRVLTIAHERRRPGYWHPRTEP